jgi:hypothetical protein
VQRQIPYPALHSQGVVVGHHGEVNQHRGGGSLGTVFLHKGLAELPQDSHELRVEKPLRPQAFDQEPTGGVALVRRMIPVIMCIIFLLKPLLLLSLQKPFRRSMLHRVLKNLTWMDLRKSPSAKRVMHG